MEDLAKGAASAFDMLHSMLEIEDDRFETFEMSMNALVKSIVDPVAVDRTPYRNKKKPKNVSNHNESDYSERSSIASTSSVSNQLPILMPAPSGRVPRKAAAKANASLREAPLNTKMRSNMTAVVKLERLSTEKIVEISASCENNRIATNVLQPIEEKLTLATARMSIKDDTNTPATDEPQQMDESIIMMPEKINEVVTVSDDEMDVQEPIVEMPPPSKPRIVRTKKAKAKATSPTPNPLPVRTTRSKKPKEKSIPRPLVEVKTESTQRVKDEPRFSNEPNNKSEAPIKQGAANVTAESVYEDAREAPSKVASPVVVAMPTVPMNSTFVQPSADATFVTPIAGLTQANATFVAPNNNATFVAPNATFVAPNNATFVAPNADPSQANETFQVDAAPMKILLQTETMVIDRPPPETTTSRITPSMNSIMTDDISDEEPAEVVSTPQNRIPIVRSAAKTNKELFNPCVQSPLKKKVEAFERHAMDAQVHTPGSQQRPTRTAGKGALLSDGASGSRSLLKQPTTPKVADLYRHIKPYTPNNQQPPAQPSGYYSSQESLRVPSMASSVSSSNSTSKLAHLNRPASASKVNQMRDSAEDIRKGLQEQADEKKRKREEKLKQVQQMREAREKAKIDKLKKQMQEKEEKMRQEAEKKRLIKERKDRDAESKRNLDEIQRNIKLQEKKNAERAKMERELAEAMRKEREHIDQQRALAEKNAMQQKMKLATSKQTHNPHKYTFDMLRTDDETDDEDSNSKTNVRPKPPQWSLRGYREDRIISQSHLQLTTVDLFFSSQPTTPDLKELFPQIQEKYLKRNSSAVWNTPPRYSTMNVPRY